MDTPRDGTHDGNLRESDLITDHPFESRGEWWDLCKHCRLARPAHAKAIKDVEHVLPEPEDREPVLYHSDEVEDL